MSDGKLVRDLIPDVIRKSGREADIRYLAGEELAAALAVKLCEEAHEAAEVIGDRQQLVEELADVHEVLSAIMAVRDISPQEVSEAAVKKTEERGAFRTGAWLVSPVPARVLRYKRADVDAQRVKWIPERWLEVFVGHETAFKALVEHSEQSGGIARSFIHAHASGEPVDLFLMAMAWGYRPRDYGPRRVTDVLAEEGAEEKIAAVVQATRADGAAAGWSALLTTHRISGLNMSFGTKLLYFAGYTTRHRPRPLILDERVRATLQVVAPGTVPAKGTVKQADYMRYLKLAEDWAAEPIWRQEPDVVEYALFD